MKVLLTGASGFVGRSILEELIEKRVKVFALVRDKDKFRVACQHKNQELINVIEADICGNFDVLNESIKHQLTELQGNKDTGGIDAVIHCAGLAHQFYKTEREKYWQVNVKGTENITKLASDLKCQRFILISSVAVYGQTLSQINQKNGLKENLAGTEKDICNPQGDYAESKYESEQVCRKICVEVKLPLTILRPATIIGEGDPGNVYRLIKLIDRGFFVWIGKGQNKKSLIYKKDVAGACQLILQKSIEDFEIFNLSNTPLTMSDIVSFIKRKLPEKKKKGARSFEIRIPDFIIDLFFLVNNKILSISKLKKIGETIHKWKSDETFSANSIKVKYGFEPIVSVEQALAKEIDWYLCKKK